MNIQPIFNSILSNPGLMLRSKNIFLLSHMRGNTSLLSHLMGSHPDVEGYYEMHMGYYSWKSLYRQKLIYLQDHSVKKNSKFFFDKLLHNDHSVTDRILKSHRTKLIIMLREPEQTIKSIISLYRKNEPEHEFCEAEGAAHYYIIRLQYLMTLLKKNKPEFFYIRAEDLIDNTAIILDNLAKWLGLTSPIPERYSLFNNTGKEKYGDSSKNIQAGKVQHKKNNYEDIKLEQSSARLASETYSLLDDFCQLNSVYR